LFVTSFITVSVILLFFCFRWNLWAEGRIKQR